MESVKSTAQEQKKIGTDFAPLDAVSTMTDVTGFGLLGHVIVLCESIAETTERGEHLVEVN